MNVDVADVEIDGVAVIVIDAVADGSGEFDGIYDSDGSGVIDAEGMNVAVVEAVTDGEAVIVIDGVADASGD